MTTHTNHPAVQTHGLVDDCPRCQEHAEHPANSLDATTIRRLLDGELHTETDIRAASRLAVSRIQ